MARYINSWFNVSWTPGTLKAMSRDPKLAKYYCPSGKTWSVTYTKGARTSGKNEKYSKIPKPSSQLLIVECAGGSLWLGPSNNWEYITTYLYDRGGGSRHNGGANYLFYDGHVEWQKLGFLRPDNANSLIPLP